MSKKALIVDDSRLACKVMAKMLDSFNIEYTEVYSAEDALISIARSHPDVIFLDHTMPGMDGLEMIKILKANPKTQLIPVLMYTAKEGEFYVKQAMALGAADVLPKGLEEIHLHKALSRLGLVTSGEVKVAKEKKFESPVIKPPQIPQSNEKTSWQLFWQQRVEPYLEQQKTQQQQEFQYNINLQTRKLIRETHLTLEQFEHALVLRMESHADFVDSTEQVARSARRKWLAVVGLLMLLMQSIIFGLIWKNEKVNLQLLDIQEANYIAQNKANEQLVLLNRKIVDLESHTKMLTTTTTGTTEADQSFLVVVNEQGEFVADLFSVKNKRNIYYGWTPTGYQIQVNSSLERIGKLLDKRFYLSDNCTGDVFIQGARGTIYRTESDDLWYVEKQAETYPLDILSARTVEGECNDYAEQVKGLLLLNKNNAVETGIDRTAKLKLTQ
jgi:CheY-like chemotaxis protein/predicted nucleic acid-binding protein